MQRLSLLFIFLILLFSSCEKESTDKNLIGEWNWTIQYSGNPAFTTTPQNTGIQERLSFNINGGYSLTQNGVTISSGTYRTSTAKSNNRQNVSTVLYSNSRVADSIAYYLLSNNNDSLLFSNDLIGTIGSGSRHYRRQ